MKKMIYIVIMMLLIFVGFCYFLFHPSILMSNIKNENYNLLELNLKLTSDVNRTNLPNLRLFEGEQVDTPLTYACRNGAEVKYLLLLIEYGGDINGTSQTNTCMYYVLTNSNDNNIENLEVLLENGYDPNKIEFLDFSLLRLSVTQMKYEDEYNIEKHFEMYRLLINYGAIEDVSIIYDIIYFRNHLILEDYLTRYTEDLNTLVNDTNPLFYSCGKDNSNISLEVVRLLLEEGMELNLKDSFGL